MAIPSRYLVENEVMQENKNTNCFGLIAEEDISSVFLHGFEVTLDGAVVVPQLSPTSSAALPDVSSIFCSE